MRKHETISSPSKQRNDSFHYRYSLLSIFEVFVAVSIVLVGFRIGVPQENAPTLAEYASFYIVKLLLGHFFRRQPVVAITLYLLLIVLTTGLAARREELAFDEPLAFSFVMFLWLFEWYLVPSLTFAYDLAASKQLPFRYLLWRTTAEIVLICPIAYYIAALILTTILGAFGIFPFE